MRTILRSVLITFAVLIAAWTAFLWLDRKMPHGTFGREMAAIRSITMLHNAQTQYVQLYGSYAATLRDLAEADLIPAELASGTKHGYSFQVKGSGRHYTITASPTDANLRQSFYSDETEVIRESSGTEPAGPQSRKLR